MAVFKIKKKREVYLQNINRQTIYAPELVTLAVAFHNVLRGPNTQPYTDGCCLEADRNSVPA